jgi:excisionase family DNA binding protein
MKERSGGMETYLTIEEAAAYLKLAQQTIRKYVLNKSIPYRKVQKSIRFRLSEIETWIDEGGGNCPDYPADDREGDLFAGMEAEETGAAGAGTAAGGEAETGADGQAGGPAADEAGEVTA